METQVRESRNHCRVKERGAKKNQVSDFSAPIRNIQRGVQMLPNEIKDKRRDENDEKLFGHS